MSLCLISRDVVGFSWLTISVDIPQRCNSIKCLLERCVDIRRVKREC